VKTKWERQADYNTTQDAASPHWDRVGHFRTQEGIRRRMEHRRGREQQEEARVEAERERREMAFRFVVVSGIVGGVVLGMALLPGLTARDDRSRRVRKGDG
jgi:hypothetical protein